MVTACGSSVCAFAAGSSACFTPAGAWLFDLAFDGFDEVLLVLWTRVDVAAFGAGDDTNPAVCGCASIAASCCSLGLRAASNNAAATTQTPRPAATTPSVLLPCVPA